MKNCACEVEWLKVSLTISKMNRPIFPTPQHQQIAETAGVFFVAQPEVDTILIVNSCARGVATADSDVDMAILVKEDVTESNRAKLEERWWRWQSDQNIFNEFKNGGRFRGLHLDIIDGRYTPEIWDDGGGPDGFELEIGNQIGYSAQLNSAGPHFQQLQEKWLPHYGQTLQQSRYTMVRKACLYDLEHVPFYADRELLFQAFDRLYKAQQEFLQALFIGRGVYPLAYNKWIEWQLTHLLELPELAIRLKSILSIEQLEAENLKSAAKRLEQLLKEYSA